MAQPAASEPPDTLEVGAAHLVSVAKFIANYPLTTATDTQAFGPALASEGSAMAVASEDTAKCTAQNTAYMAMATTHLATTTLVVAMDSLRLVSEQAVLVRRR